MIRRPPRSTPFPTRRSSDLREPHPLRLAAGQLLQPAAGQVVQVGDAQHLVERSEEHTSELQSPCNLVCRLLLEKKKREWVVDDPHHAHPCCVCLRVAARSRL